MTAVMNLRMPERDPMDLDRALEELERMGLDTSDIFDLDTARLRLRRVQSPQHDGRPLYGDSAQDRDLTEAVEKDLKDRQALQDFCRQCRDCLTALPRHCQADLQRLFPNCLQKLDSLVARLSSRECLVVVAGERGAGKSSLINLLAGNKILPTHLVLGTKTVCELRHSERKRFVTHYPREAGQGPVVRECLSEDQVRDFLTELMRHVTYVSPETNRSPYDKIEIFWPLPILGESMVLVDSPGIDDTHLVSHQLQDYLSRAFAFIYVINISNAGGVHRDRLGRILQQAADRSEEGFDPSNALFVCNWWDQVAPRAMERENVLRVTHRNLAAIWSGVQRHQLFPLSAKEAMRALESDFVTDEYRNLVRGLRQVLPTTFKTKLQGYYRWLSAVLKRTLYTLKMATSLDFKQVAEKEATFRSVCHQIEALERDANEKIDVMRDGLDREVDMISRKLIQFIRSEEVRREFGTWTPPELLQAGSVDSKKLLKDAASKFSEHLASVIDSWESQNQIVSKVKANIIKAFQRDLDLFDDQLQRIECVLFEGLDKYVVADLHISMLPIRQVWKKAAVKQADRPLDHRLYDDDDDDDNNNNINNSGCLSLGSAVSMRPLDLKAPGVKEALKRVRGAAASSSVVSSTLADSRRNSMADLQQYQQPASDLRSSVPVSGWQGFAAPRFAVIDEEPSSTRREQARKKPSRTVAATALGSFSLAVAAGVSSADIVRASVNRSPNNLSSSLSSTTAAAAASRMKSGGRSGSMNDLVRFSQQTQAFGDLFLAILQQLDDKDVMMACKRFFRRIQKRFDAVSRLLPEFLHADRQLLLTLEAELREDQRRLSGIYPQCITACTALQGRMDMYYVHRLFVPEFSMDELPYDARSRIGQGSFADVYGSRLASGERVALKVHRFALSNANVTDVLIEDRTLRNIKHKNIMGYYGSALEKTEAGIHWVMVLEICPKTIKQRMLVDDSSAPGCQEIVSLQRVGMREVAQIVVQVCDALTYLHDRDIVHRDLKPDNILMTEDDVVKLADVGLAAHVNEITPNPAGTPVYMAPEILQRTGHYDTKVDIYSLAVILWELWYGKDVAEHIGHLLHESLEEAVRKGLRPSLALTHRPPEDWLKVIQAGWDLDPKKRPTSRELAKFFRAVLSSRG